MRLCPELAGQDVVTRCLGDLADEMRRRGRPLTPEDAARVGAQALNASVDAARRPGERPLVLLQGSITNRGAEFLSLGEALASRGYEVVAVVEAAPAAQPAYDAVAIDRARRALKLAKGETARPYAVVAWSFGGAPAALEAIGPAPPVA
ncbi:MAG TPA: hypothetical protein VFF48_07040 [Brevundimonas sp.]|nr:hypothetical protein [Brevundimonas sp.]